MASINDRSQTPLRLPEQELSRSDESRGMDQLADRELVGRELDEAIRREFAKLRSTPASELVETPTWHTHRGHRG